jgi:hypothetical protein
MAEEAPDEIVKALRDLLARTRVDEDHRGTRPA